MADPPSTTTATKVVSPGTSKGMHEIPIVDRAPFSRWRTYMITLGFVLFLFPIHCAQLFFYPMTFVAGGIRELYWAGIRSTKETFARCLVYISGQTTLVITADDSLDLDDIIKKDQDSGKMMIKLADQAVYMSNHQMYADWCYIWSFLYLADLHGALTIILKASLRNVPMAGPAMRLWEFIFLSNWTKDRVPTGNTLFELGRRATRHKRPVALLVYPEGTLVSKLTRPRSAAYADKMGIPDMRNQLLPRSTGLLFSLRTLRLNVPDLALYDITVGYPGLPPQAYAQTYYSLQSIYTASKQGPPQVHLHLRKYDLDGVPIGSIPDVSAQITKDPVTGRDPDPYRKKLIRPDKLDDQLTEDDRKVFDEWVRDRWTEKDQLLDRFYQDGQFPAREGQRKEIKVELRGFDDYIAISINYVAVWLMYKIIRYTWRRGPDVYSWALGKILGA